jgi:hypothetical protein
MAAKITACNPASRKAALRSSAMRGAGGSIIRLDG